VKGARTTSSDSSNATTYSRNMTSAESSGLVVQAWC
jgi:hypothetical protein